jgi:hypothetical protein
MNNYILLRLLPLQLLYYCYYYDYYYSYFGPLHLFAPTPEPLPQQSATSAIRVGSGGPEHQLCVPTLYSFGWSERALPLLLLLILLHGTSNSSSVSIINTHSSDAAVDAIAHLQAFSCRPAMPSYDHDYSYFGLLYPLS